MGRADATAAAAAAAALLSAYLQSACMLPINGDQKAGYCRSPNVLLTAEGRAKVADAGTTHFGMLYNMADVTCMSWHCYAGFR